jgi:hypothetical protein
MPSLNEDSMAPIGVFSFAHLLQILPISFNAFSNDLSVRRRSSASMTGIEFRSCRRKQRFKTGGVGLSRKPGDQTKDSFSNRQIVNNVSFPIFNFF